MLQPHGPGLQDQTGIFSSPMSGDGSFVVPARCAARDGSESRERGESPGPHTVASPPRKKEARVGGGDAALCAGPVGSGWKGRGGGGWVMRWMQCVGLGAVKTFVLETQIRLYYTSIIFTGGVEGR